VSGVRLFSDSTINEIRGRIDLIDLVSDYVPLKRAGRNLKGLCPFHQEKTPSFIVSPDKQIFYCFGCHQGGDLFGFLMKTEGLTFPEAVEKLAQRAGVKLEQSHPSSNISSDEKENLFQANRIAAWHYHENLKKSPAAEKARAYLTQRGVTSAEIERFRLGFSLPHSEELQKVYRDRRVSLDAAVKVGVLKQGERGFYETFRGRLIFPIFNRENKVTGLGGRIIEAQNDLAKYINSPDSPIYDKSSNLFGLPLAKEAIRKKNRVFVVEGYLDVIALHQFGLEEAVAPLGTALTSRQIALLKRYSTEIIVLFDGDEAGWKAAERSLPLLLEQNISAQVLVLPPSEDPDTYLRKYGAQNFIEKLKEVRNLFSLIIDKTLAKNGREIAGKAASIQELKPYLLKLASPLERNLYVRKVAQGLDVPETWVFEELGLKHVSQSPSDLPMKKAHPTPKTEEMLLEIFLKFEELRPSIIDKISSDEFINEEMKLLAVFLWNLEGVRGLSISEIMNKISDPLLQSRMSRLALIESLTDEKTAETFASDCIKKIKLDDLKRKFGDLSLEIKEAEASRQTERLTALLKEKAKQGETLSAFLKEKS
jgi:DNA primase